MAILCTVPNSTQLLMVVHENGIDCVVVLVSLVSYRLNGNTYGYHRVVYRYTFHCLRPTIYSTVYLLSLSLICLVWYGLAIVVWRQWPGDANIKPIKKKGLVDWSLVC